MSATNYEAMLATIPGWFDATIEALTGVGPCPCASCVARRTTSEPTPQGSASEPSGGKPQ